MFEQSDPTQASTKSGTMSLPLVFGTEEQREAPAGAKQLTSWSLAKIELRAAQATDSSAVKTFPRVSGPHSTAAATLRALTTVPTSIGIAKPECQLIAK